MRNTLAALAALSFSVPASAAFVGWSALTRVDAATSTVFVDVVANFDSSADRALNVFNANISVSGAQFLQDTSIGRKAWAPQIGQTSRDRDSFMTIGMFETSEATFAASTAGDPNFTGTPGAWSGTPLSAPSTSIPPNAGWYTSNPTSTENVAFDLSTVEDGDWQNRQAGFGVWVAHFALDQSAIAAGASISFGAKVGYKASAAPGSAIIGNDTQTFLIPAPGALALLGAAGLIGSRARLRN